MKRKKNPFIFRPHVDHEQEQKKGNPGSMEENDTSLDNIRQDILGWCDKLNVVQLSVCFEDELGTIGINSLDKAEEHLKSVHTDKGLNYILDVVTAQVETLKGKLDSIPEKNEEEQEDLPPDFEPDDPDDFGSGENEVPEEPKEDFDPETIENMGDVKVLLVQFLDRLEIIERKVEYHTKTLDDVNKGMIDFNDLIIGVKDTLIQAIAEQTQKTHNDIKKLKENSNGGIYIVKYDEPGIPDTKFDGPVPKVFPTAMQFATSRINMFLHGPTGSGKTTLAKMIATALKLPFSALSCSEGMDESMFTGSIMPIGEGGAFEYLPSTFIDFYENGGVFLIDEMCAADPNLLITPNAAIGNDFFYLPLRWKKPLIKRHKDFVCIAADNTQGSGGDENFLRNQLDAATLDRFKAGMLLVDYDEAVEKAVIDPTILEWGKLTRRGIKSLGFTKPLSTRVMKDLSKLKAQHNWSLTQIVDQYFSDWNPDNVTNINNWQKRELENMQIEIAKMKGV